jgi:hypothetical protein
MVTTNLTILGIMDIDISSGVYIIQGIAAAALGPRLDGTVACLGIRPEPVSSLRPR